MSDAALAGKSCVPCEGGAAALGGEALEALARRLPEWRVVDGHRLVRSFTFEDFAGALAYVVKVGAMAEVEGHHPDVHLSWGRATIEIWTHAVDGLTESDFVFAAKCDALYG